MKVPDDTVGAFCSGLKRIVPEPIIDGLAQPFRAEKDYAEGKQF
jgi:hypothetical protein